MSERIHKVRTPYFPCYSHVRQLLTILEGVPKSVFTGLIREVWGQTGTPQNPVDWSNPDSWIPSRLSGAESELARRIWEESGRALNPRYLDGPNLFIKNHELLATDGSGVYRCTERGGAFLKDEPQTVREIDDAEGLPQLVGILATKTRARRADLLPEWSEFVREHSNYTSTSAIYDTLQDRLRNLVERALVERDGNVYAITQTGIDYVGSTSITARRNDPKHEVTQAIDAYNRQQREALRERLSSMPPYHFEHLIRNLLEKMGYEDVTVTQQSGDRGVDVIANARFGFTTFREVVQVKRHQGSIIRPILDQLRGALPYHKAFRGTIITLGNFSTGCKEAALFPGAAPITLINGEKLLDLLIDHKLGISEQLAKLYKLDESFFETLQVAQQAEEASDA
jgi:restriction system protein